MIHFPPVNSKAVEALLALGEYTGTEDAFLRESTERIRGVLNCSLQEAVRILQGLRGRGEIDFRMTLGGELPPRPANVPFARWLWYIPVAGT